MTSDCLPHQVDVERWAAREHRRLQPLQAHVWRALQGVKAAAQELWAGARVELYGSWASGLHLAFSDVDLLVCGTPPGLSAVAALRSLADRLAERPWIASIKLIETADDL